jgi:hypothetical protein
MKFDVCLDELKDLKLPEAEWDLRVKWSYDLDYSPKEGLNDKYCFELQKFVDGKWVDITDDLSTEDYATILNLIEQNDDDDIL